MDNSTSNNYTLWGNAGGWLLAFFLSKKALADRDTRLKNLDEWQQEHEKNHPNLNEALRMHAESREMMQHIVGMIDRNLQAHQEDFKHLNDRLDRVVEKK